MKAINRWITQEKSLINNLRQQIADLNNLTQQVQDCMPEEWRDYCQVVRFDLKQKILVLSTSEQSLLTSLRYMQQQILTGLKKKSALFSSIEKINSIYTPQVSNTNNRVHQPALSNDSAQLCKRAAEKCPPALKKSLERLSKTLAGH
jgi:hypothetical protein